MKTESSTPIFECSTAPPQATHAPAMASTRMAGKILADPDYILRAWAAILIVAAIDLIWAGHAGLKFTGIGVAVPAVAMFAAVGLFFDRTGRTPQIAEAAHYCALWIAFGVALAIYSYVVATLRMPMCDLQFAKMDAALGFNWAAGFDAVMSSRWIFRYVLSHAYNSIYFQVFASIGYFAMIRRTDRMRELFWIGILSAFITSTLAGVFPALGPFINGDIPSCSAVLASIRDGSVTQFALRDLTGIVAFPSFHTVLALLLIYVHRPPLWTFVPALILNALMLVATPFAGHHYLVDLIAGAVVAAISIAIVEVAMRPRSVAQPQAV
jgi:hypothetical protein